MRVARFVVLRLAVVLLFGQATRAKNHYGQKPCQLNSTLGGRLAAARPLVLPCYSQPGGAACAELKTAISSYAFRTGKYQGYQYIQSEACMADPDDQCLLDPITLSTPANASCRQGLVSPYFVEVSGAADAQAVFEYAKQTNTTISIKNTGHDYQARGSRQGSIALWTHGLREMVFDASFVAEGCSGSSGASPVSAVTFGAGVSMSEAILFAHDHGVVFAAASSPSIGVSGGWLLNGGHSVISGSYGLAVDRVLQITIVTPGGEVRVASACSNPDLFWALRGGGGGSFGMVLNSTFVAEPETPVTNGLFLLPATADKRGFVELLASNMREWALAGWGGPSSTSLAVLVNPFLNVSESQVMLAPLSEYVNGQNGTVIFQEYATWFEFWVNVVNGSFATPETTSLGILPTSKIIPESVFMNTTAREDMVDVIMGIDAAGLAPYFLAVTPLRYGRDHPSPNTSINPAWYHSVWHLVTYVQWKSTDDLAERRQTVAQLRNITDSFSALTDEGCMYANEASPWVEDWTEQFWGDNYPRLLKVKASVDKLQLLSCWHCVGWDESLPDYGCMSRIAE